ncbi:hypothetical protein HK098_001611 [Nowakowskiella sp. JEL0407]|nr:hypothetical protein HK098_001611 [Nowakowskiella sp. JEL0407]
MICAHSRQQYPPPSARTPVYKDECTKCFDHNLLPQGIDVCLSCFNGGCTDNDRNHSLLHSKDFNHPLVLNIRQVLKQKGQDAESPPPAKLTKLAISGESADDKYDIITSVRCLSCGGVEIDKMQPNLIGVVDGILAALSARKQSDVKSWEENELTSCDHITGLVQSAPKPLEPQAISHCSNCDLKENLWLCLSCGNLGCGRQQMGGLAGNGHGVQHFMNEMHPVSVKLGTITPEGTADIYCYACDYERVDPKLATHLRNFGINIESQQKTERTITELNLEFQNFQFGMTNEEGKLLEPVFGPGFTGLSNLGNSCYMASVIQTIFNITPFQMRYLELFVTHTPTCRDPTANCFLCQMAKLADGILSGRYSVPVNNSRRDEEEKEKLIEEQHGVAPFMFKNLVGKDHPEFSTMRQQDAFEFLQHLTRMIEIKERPFGNTDPTLVFQHILEDKLRCQGCNCVRYTDTKMSFNNLLVPVRPIPSNVVVIDGKQEVQYEPVTLEDCIRETWKSEFEYRCPECKDVRVAERSTRVKVYPQVLVVAMNRFVYENYVPKKFGVDILAPLDLDLNPFRGTGLQEGEVELPQTNDQPAAAESQLNQEVMGQLQMMGFPEIRCKKALLATGNSADTEVAMNWLIEHMEDADIDDPIPVSVPNSESVGASQGDISMLCDMGFTVSQAKYALKQTNNDVERAVDWLFSHPDDPMEDVKTSTSNTTPPKQIEQDAKPANYKLIGFISHRGTSTSCGHYVAHLKKKFEGKEEWVLFNDEKVVKVEDIGKAVKEGYIYFYERL